MLDAVFEGRRKVLGNEADDTTEAIKALCNVLNASGQQEKAEKLRPTSRPSTAAET